MGDALMSEPVIYVAKIMAQSADAAANSIHENLQQAVGQQKSHAAKARVRSCVSSRSIRCTPILIWSFSKESAK